MHLKYARKFHNYQNDRNFTYPDDEDEKCSMQIVVLEKTKSLNTPCSPCVHFGKNPIQRFRQIFLSEFYFGLNHSTS